jgi:hypothetical protein
MISKFVTGVNATVSAAPHAPVRVHVCIGPPPVLAASQRNKYLPVFGRNKPPTKNYLNVNKRTYSTAAELRRSDHFGFARDFRLPRARRGFIVPSNGSLTVSKLPDPTHLDPRTVSSAEAVHGRYDGQITYANGHKTIVRHYGVQTDCLRAGDRCMSFFVEGGGGDRANVHANGTCTRHADFDDTCSLGGNYHATYTFTMALPQPLQNPRR